METGTAVVVGVVVIVGVVVLAMVVQNPPQQTNFSGPQPNQSNTTSDIASGITTGLFGGIMRLINTPSAPGAAAAPGAGTASGARATDPNARGLDTMSRTGSWDGTGNTASGWNVGPSASGRT